MISGSSGLTGFSQGSNRRVFGVWVVFLLALASWALGGYIGAAIAVVVGVALVFVRWWGQPAWSWAVLWRRGRRPITWDAPITVANNRSGGGVRVQDGVAVVAVQLLGRAHQATTVTGSVTVETDNVIDIAELVPMLDHALGLQLDSISIVTFGSRHGTVGDFPRVYDSEIGTPPYAGRRETWLIMRLRVIDNAQSLRWRITVGTAVVSVAQRIAGLLRCQGLRAKVATATDLVELDRRLGVGRGGRERATLEGRARRGGLDDHLRLPPRGDLVAGAGAGVDAARRRGHPERDGVSGRDMHRDNHRAHADAGADRTQCGAASAQR